MIGEHEIRGKENGDGIMRLIDAEYVLKIIGDQLYGEMSAGDEYLYDHKTYDDGLEWCFELIRNVANNTQETISDCISRQAAIEKISETIWDTAVANDVITILKELPSAQPVQWMPLPEPPEVEEQ